jgi:hypothetical protein
MESALVVLAKNRGVIEWGNIKVIVKIKTIPRIVARRGVLFFRSLWA